MPETDKYVHVHGITWLGKCLSLICAVCPALLEQKNKKKQNKEDWKYLFHSPSSKDAECMASMPACGSSCRHSGFCCSMAQCTINKVLGAALGFSPWVFISTFMSRCGQIQYSHICYCPKVIHGQAGSQPVRPIEWKMSPWLENHAWHTMVLKHNVQKLRKYLSLVWD